MYISNNKPQRLLFKRILKTIFIIKEMMRKRKQIFNCICMRLIMSSHVWLLDNSITEKGNSDNIILIIRKPINHVINKSFRGFFQNQTVIYGIKFVYFSLNHLYDKFLIIFSKNYFVCHYFKEIKDIQKYYFLFLKNP